MADNDEAPARANGGAPHAATAAPRRRAAAASSGTRRPRSAALKVDADSLEGQVAQLQQDLKSITTTLGRMGHTAGDELAARGQSAFESAQDEFGAVERQIKDAIREKPLTAVAGAIALGFLIAVITR